MYFVVMYWSHLNKSVTVRSELIATGWLAVNLLKVALPETFKVDVHVVA